MELEPVRPNASLNHKLLQVPHKMTWTRWMVDHGISLGTGRCAHALTCLTTQSLSCLPQEKRSRIFVPLGG